MNSNQSNEIESLFSGFVPGSKHSLLPLLQLIQDNYGMVSKEHAIKLADFLNITTTKVYSVASFYDYFTFNEKHDLEVSICKGFTCHTKGNETLKAEIDSKVNELSREIQKINQKVNINFCSCRGQCKNAPVVKFNDSIILNATSDIVNEKINEYFDY